MSPITPRPDLPHSIILFSVSYVMTIYKFYNCSLRITF
uniref:Uncharacterized protein n=1 Tax=Ciona intestinalis TaxID=7719 RepID=H2XS78_CIOIN